MSACYLNTYKQLANKQPYLKKIIIVRVTIARANEMELFPLDMKRGSSQFITTINNFSINLLIIN